jgi:tRNA (guanine-N7-)-methyltransferase
MGQKKLVRFNEIKTFDNVLEFPTEMKGKWHTYFGNDNPITLELACGKGEYAVGLGRMYPDRNFIGVDIKGNRIWRGAKTALEEGLTNVAFVRSPIDKINEYFEKGEVSEIWITFPDPQLKGARMKKRLTYSRFLRLYQEIIKDDAAINLKTDSPDLYHFTKAVIELFELPVEIDTDDLYNSPHASPELRIKTHYEGLDIAGSNTIHYLRFGLNKALPEEKDVVLKQLFVNQYSDEENN